MHSIRRSSLILAAFVLAAGSGCSVSSIHLPFLNPTPTAIPPTVTPLPVPTETPMPTATETALPTFTPIPVTSTSTVPPGVDVTYGNTRLFVPSGVGSGTTNSTVTDIELPYTNPGGAAMPQHSKLVLNDYPVQGALLTPEILIFPAAQFAQYGELSGQIVTTLQTVTFFDGQPLPPGLPDGPFNAHVGAVTFANGHGIRYLTQFDQGPTPVNNHELIYYFHGLTSDGNAYVGAVLPIQAPFLAPDENPASPLPAGGVPFTLDDLGGYFQTISDRLNATPPDQFTPSLAQLDALLQSIAIK